MRRVIAPLVVLVVAALAGGPLPNGSDATGTDRDGEHRRVVEHWSAARQASANPRDVIVADGGRGRATPEAGGPGVRTSAAWADAGPVTLTTGRVFFTEGNASYSCSGSAVDSAHGNLVLTAGHCVHGGGSRGSFVTDWIFFPGWTGPSDTPPLGAWTATDLFTTTLWSSAGGWDDDAGFAVVTGDIGRDTLEAELTIRSVTAPAISFGAAPVTGDVVTALGYPAAKKATGNVLSYCTGSVEVGLDGNGTIAMRCDMTAGSSGGPWFGPLQNTTGSTGTIRSLVSYSYPSMRGYLFGPILDAGEETAFVAASGAGDCGATAPVGYACADQAA